MVVKRTSKMLALVIIALLITLFYQFFNLYFAGPDSSISRRFFFILINLVLLYGVIRRPFWFVWFWGIMTLQQLISHAIHFTNHLENQIEWVDLIIMLAGPVIFIWLWMDEKNYRMERERSRVRRRNEFRKRRKRFFNRYKVRLVK